MATYSYMAGRKKYQRPQAMLWSDNPGTIQVINSGTENEEIVFLPDGYEIGQAVLPEALDSDINQFIILSDDNRQPIDFSIDRIEKRERMINGRMRSYHIADKLSISTSWQMLPSRSFSQSPEFDESGATNLLVKSTLDDQSQMYTTDGGAGGVEMLDWYNKHKGSFWVYLSYDNYKVFGDSSSAYAQIQKYNQIVEMQISSFSYSVVKRGGTNFDFWDISVTLEEV